MNVCKDCKRRIIIPNCHDSCGDYMKAKILHIVDMKAEKFEKSNDSIVPKTVTFFRRPGGML